MTVSLEIYNSNKGFPNPWVGSSSLPRRIFFLFSGHAGEGLSAAVFFAAHHGKAGSDETEHNRNKEGAVHPDDECLHGLRPKGHIIADEQLHHHLAWQASCSDRKRQSKSCHHARLPQRG